MERAAFKLVSSLEGIIPAIETSHALAYLPKLVPTLPAGQRIVLNFSGRGDKDVNTAINYFNVRTPLPFATSNRLSYYQTISPKRIEGIVTNH